MLPALCLPNGARDLIEVSAIEDCPFTPDGPWADANDSIKTDLAWSTARVPVAPSDIQPVATESGLVLGVPIVVLAGKRKAEEPVAISADE